MNLVRDEQHRYWLDGRRLSGVTEALQFARILPDHSRTDPFYSERGTAVHSAIALWIKNELDFDSLDPQILPYLQNAQRVVEQLRLDRLTAVVEELLYDSVHSNAGQIDLFAPSQVLGRHVLVDWKSGDYEPGHACQVAGYWRLLWSSFDNHALVATAKVCVASLNGPQPRLHWIDPDDHLDAYMGAVAVHQWHLRNGSKEIE